MTKKRKSDAMRLDEVDRSMYTSFCSAANSLSHLYTQAMNQQRLSFQLGERHALDKLYQWMLRQQEEGSRVSTADIMAYLQNELEYTADETPMSPRAQFQQQNAHTPALVNASVGPPASTNLSVPGNLAQGVRSAASEQQSKNSTVFSSALSCPVRGSLQHYQLTQGGYPFNNVMSLGSGPRNHENIDLNSPTSESMDMHADSPGNGFP